jgi:hypothetical protein
MNKDKKKKMMHKGAGSERGGAGSKIQVWAQRGTELGTGAGPGSVYGLLDGSVYMGLGVKRVMGLSLI